MKEAKILEINGRLIEDVVIDDCLPVDVMRKIYPKFDDDLRKRIEKDTLERRKERCRLFKVGDPVYIIEWGRGVPSSRAVIESIDEEFKFTIKKSDGSIVDKISPFDIGLVNKGSLKSGDPVYYSKRVEFSSGRESTYEVKTGQMHVISMDGSEVTTWFNTPYNIKKYPLGDIL
ncbi:MAG: hypothetical protein HY225_03610 [Candidatus Vogelbacteria bacterium]|nr:hypothetical protein [Candidatus Vogelbacteria bacterium]